MKPSVEEKIGSWGVPIRGTISTLPAHELPEDALFTSKNVLTRDGKLRSRPGLLRLPNSIVDTTTGIPTGAFNYRNPQGSEVVLVGTTTGIYSWNGVTSRKRTGLTPAQGNAPAFAGALTGDLDHPSRFTSIQLENTVYALHTNGRDLPLQWDGLENLFRGVTGDPVGPSNNPGLPVPCPRFTDWVNIGGRIVGILPPYLVQWTNLDSIVKWPALNFRALSDEPSALVTIRQLGTLGSGVAYKTDAIWVCFQEGATDASAFRFEFRGFYDGPAGPQAVADANGIHLYMTATGRVGSFNGSDHLWILDGLWPTLRDLIHPDFAHRIVSAYDSNFHEATFWFPRRADADGFPRGVLTITLPKPEVGRGAIGGFPGALSTLWGGAVTTALGYKLVTKAPKVMALASDSATVFYRVGGDPDVCVGPGELAPDEAKDAGIPFDFHWQTGLQESPGKQPTAISAIEPFFQRDVNYGMLTVRPVLSQALAVDGGELGPAKVINLEERKIRPTVDQNVRARFHGVRYEYTPTLVTDTPPKVRYVGSLIYGSRLE